MNAQLTVEDIAGQPIAIEYVAGNPMEASGEDLESVLSLTVEIDTEAAELSVTLDNDDLAELDGGTDIGGVLLAEGELPFFDDEFPIVADADQAREDEEETAPDPRLTEMQDVLVTLRDSEVSHALRLLRQKFPHIPFPFRVRALMAVRHGAVVG